MANESLVIKNSQVSIQQRNLACTRYQVKLPRIRSARIKHQK